MLHQLCLGHHWCTHCYLHECYCPFNRSMIFYGSNTNIYFIISAVGSMVNIASNNFRKAHDLLEILKNSLFTTSINFPDFFPTASFQESNLEMPLTLWRDSQRNQECFVLRNQNLATWYTTASRKKVLKIILFAFYGHQQVRVMLILKMRLRKIIRIPTGSLWI